VDQVLQLIDFHLSGEEFFSGFPVGQLHRALLVLPDFSGVIAAIERRLSDVRIYTARDKAHHWCVSSVSHRAAGNLVPSTFKFK